MSELTNIITNRFDHSTFFPISQQTPTNVMQNSLYEKNPYKNAFQSDDIEGFSLGAGFKFRGGKIDLSYLNSKNTAPYNFYPNNNQVNAAELDTDTSRFTATLVLNI